jgi:N-acyl-D-amino-acid deacylase
MADVAIQGDRIVAVGALAGWQATQTVDAGGKALAPGFIDTHTHDDRLLLADPSVVAKASQGVTTVVAGNCGISLAPLVHRQPPPPLDLIDGGNSYQFATFADYLAALDSAPAAINAVFLVGHSTLRVGAMDRLDRPATADEIAVMRGRLEEGLAAGAVGLSTGLYYPPAIAAPTDEIVALAAPLRDAGGLYCTHMRDESDHVLDSLDETFEIGARVGVPVVISHHKVVGARNAGRSVETLARIEQARASQPVGLDVYPYPASSTILRLDMLPVARRIRITWSKPEPRFAGWYLDEIAAELGLELAAAAERLLPAGAIYFSMDEEDVQRILAYPHTMVGSDGLPHDRHPHPRLWGTFARVLGYYARDLGLFSLEEAVRRMTSLPAERFSLRDRGVLREGAYADLVLFDPDTVAERATFDEPMQPAAGIELVLVNGQPVWQNGQSTGSRPGRALRRGH